MQSHRYTCEEYAHIVYIFCKCILQCINIIFLKNEESALFYSFALAFKSTIIQFPCEVNIINKETFGEK